MPREHCSISQMRVCVWMKWHSENFMFIGIHYLITQIKCLSMCGVLNDVKPGSIWKVYAWVSKYPLSYDLAWCLVMSIFISSTHLCVYLCCEWWMGGKSVNNWVDWWIVEGTTLSKSHIWFTLIENANSLPCDVEEWTGGSSQRYVVKVE